MKINYAGCLLTMSFALTAGYGQTFSSGSTGSDGALSYTTPGIYVFNPATFTPPLDPAGDGIFNFTTITIAAGVTLQVTGSVFNGPVVFLAQGAVQINGTIDLSGQAGFSASNTTQRTYTIPGAGGYPGGYPAVGSNPAGAGLGPGGGAAPSQSCGVGFPGRFTGNQFLVPLIGGSGGGGYGVYAGGAGGGAILIASSVSISGAGSINASGGVQSSLSGGGAGGGIRLVAPSVTLSGSLDVHGNSSGYCAAASPGVVRIEAFTIGAISAVGNLYTATPFGLFVSPAGLPAISVVSIGGVPVAATPTGSFTVPDVTVNSSAPLTIAIQASNIPLGTMPTVTIFSENGPDQTITATALAGTTAASSTATASVTLPPGFSKGFVTATYTQ